MRLKNAGIAVCVLSVIVAMGTAVPADGAESRELVFDRAKMHALAVEESLKPIRPGIPGKVFFWNFKATSFIYAPAFEFSPVAGATSYRFTITTYGPTTWVIEVPEVHAPLPMWKELPVGNIRTSLLYFKNEKGRWDRKRQKPILLEKKAGDEAGTFTFNPEKGATLYRYQVEGVKTFTFESEKPWDSLAPVWKDLPEGSVNLKVEGLDAKGGNVLGVALLGRSKGRNFEKRVAFNGPYHEAAMGYIEAGTRWLKYFSSQDRRFTKWLKGEGDPKRLGKYPCKEEISVIKGTIMLAKMETDEAKKKDYITMARNAARTVIKGSFPDDWGLAGMPPTYGEHKEGKKMSYGVVLMAYPAEAGDAYLDLYAITKEKEFLDAAVRVANVYKKLQLPNGTWDMMMDAKTGKKMSWSKSYVVPTSPMALFTRLSKENGLKEYQPLAEATWKWIESDMTSKFRFEGQFEDTCSKGGDPWHISHHTARAVSNYLILNSNDNATYLPLAEEVLRWQEDQFMFWELPPSRKRDKYTPFMVEQHNGPLIFGNPGYTSDIGGLLHAWLIAYEATNKEIYLAKATTLANAMVTIQKVKYRGNFISTFWGDGGGLDQWVNCHMSNAAHLIEFGQMLKRKNISVKIHPDFGKDLPYFNQKK